MTKDDIPKLQQALQRRFPSLVVKAAPFDLNHRLAVAASGRGRRVVVASPATLDYTALDWTEWLHRFTLELEKAKLP